MVKIDSWLIEFLVVNAFIIIPVYIALLVSMLLFTAHKFIRTFFEIEKALTKSKKVSELSDETTQTLNERSYEIKKEQKTTLETMRDIRLKLEQYFSALISIKDQFEKKEDNEKRNL